MNSGLLEQLPVFSQYDPGASDEGKLDPLGLAPVAERIADRLAPGLRARMSRPRFATLSAVGAMACLPLRDLYGDDGQTTFDIAFEWLLVEALVRYPAPDRLKGLPGSQKGQRAVRQRMRLGTSTYLASPRVFGFTGVHRPFSMDSRVLGPEGLPAENADGLIAAWEREQRLGGFLSGGRNSQGMKLRQEIERQCRLALVAGHTTAPPGGWLMAQLATALAPAEAKSVERAVLRGFITTGPHAVRNELAAALVKQKPSPDASEVDLAHMLVARTTGETRVALEAAIAFETCATKLDYSLRRVLAYATATGGAFTIEEGARAPQIDGVAQRIGEEAQQAIEQAAKIDDSLAAHVETCLETFIGSLSAAAMVEKLIARHELVQDAKGKRMWVDRLQSRWVVRPAFRNQRSDLDEEKNWVHPMRLRTLANFLRETE